MVGRLNKGKGTSLNEIDAWTMKRGRTGNLEKGTRRPLFHSEGRTERKRTLMGGKGGQMNGRGVSVQFDFSLKNKSRPATASSDKPAVPWTAP